MPFSENRGALEGAVQKGLILAVFASCIASIVKRQCTGTLVRTAKFLSPADECSGTLPYDLLIVTFQELYVENYPHFL